MAPTETDVLENYLIRPGSLDAILTFDSFAERFPAGQRDGNQVRLLWRDLVAQRERILEEVRTNIAAEVRQGQEMRREVLRAKREAGREEPDGEVEMERALFGDLSGTKKAKHTLDSIIPELDGAADALEDEIERLQEEETALRDEVTQIVGQLSDLRYGKFANAQIKDEVVDGLKNLQDTCESKR